MDVHQTYCDLFHDVRKSNHYVGHIIDIRCCMSILSQTGRKNLEEWTMNVVYLVKEPLRSGGVTKRKNNSRNIVVESNWEILVWSWASCWWNTWIGDFTRPWEWWSPRLKSSDKLIERKQAFIFLKEVSIRKVQFLSLNSTSLISQVYLTWMLELVKIDDFTEEVMPPMCPHLILTVSLQSR